MGHRFRERKHKRRERDTPGNFPQRFKVTTNSNHKFEVYLNFAARMKLTAPLVSAGCGS